MSKAAATIAATKFALKLKDEGFIAVTLDPGAVDTSSTAAADGELAVIVQCAVEECSVLTYRRTGSVFAAFASQMKNKTGKEITGQTPEASVEAQLTVIDGLGPSHNGLFLSHVGGEFGATK